MPGRSDRDVDGDTFDDVVLFANVLGHFGVEEGYEAERSERFGNEDVRHFSVFVKVIAQVVGRYVFGATADEDFERQTFFRVRYEHVAPSSVDGMLFGEDAHLCVVIGEPNEREAFRLAPRVPLQPDLPHFAEALEVVSDRLLGGLPRQAQHDQVGRVFLHHSVY